MTVLTKEDIKAHARITIADDDGLVENKIAAAEAWIASYIGVPTIDDADAFPDGTPEPIKEAVRQLVTQLYDVRTPQVIGSGITQAVEATPGLFDLLTPYRSRWFG